MCSSSSSSTVELEVWCREEELLRFGDTLGLFCCGVPLDEFYWDGRMGKEEDRECGKERGMEGKERGEEGRGGEGDGGGGC